MNLYSNIPDLIKRLELLKAAVSASAPAGEGGFQDTLVDAVNEGRALMDRRIFNRSEDALGKPLGDYHGSKTRLTKKKFSTKRDDEDEEKERKKVKRNFNKAVKADADARYTEYEKVRLGSGRQIAKKDLEMSGSTRISIKTQKIEGTNKVVMAFDNQENAKIARYQEQQIGNIRAGINAVKGKAEPAKIFVLSESELNQVKTVGNRGINQIMNKIIKENLQS